MTTLKRMAIALISMTLIISLSSCWRDVFGFQCGESRLLGILDFADSTKNLYSNWTGKEILVFKDSLGNEEEWYSKEGKKVIKQRMIVNTLCDSGWLDKQHEYFDSEYHSLSFTNRTPNKQEYFQLSLFTDAFDNQGKIVTFNQFMATGYAESIFLSSARETPIPPQFQDSLGFNFKFVADTTILGKNFKNVYYKTNVYHNSGIYFQKSKMVIAYRNAGKTWLLNRIK